MANVTLLLESHKLLSGRSKVIWDPFALLLEIDEVLSYWGCNIKTSTVLCLKPLSQIPVQEWEKIAHEKVFVKEGTTF